MPSRSERALLLVEGLRFGGDFDTSIAAGLEANGFCVDLAAKGDPWPPDYVIVIGYGPFTYEQGHLHTVTRQVTALAGDRRPTFIWWLTENPPATGLPPGLLKVAAAARLRLDRVLSGVKRGGAWRRWALKGHRLRVLGQVLAGWEAGAPDLLVMTSAARARFYGRFGVSSLVAPLPYHPIYGEDMDLRRDIDVLFLGSLNDGRRRRIVPSLVSELRRRGLRVVVETHLYGEERTEMLNRTAVLLNVLRAPQDFVGQRLLLGAANGALVVSEPMTDASPFVPGRHFVSGSLSELADLAEHYARDATARQPITDEARRFVHDEMSAAATLARVLAALPARRLEPAA